MKLRYIWVIIQFLAGKFVAFIRFALALLAADDKHLPVDDELSPAIRGGQLNYRTNKFDEGNDAAGQYKL